MSDEVKARLEKIASGFDADAQFGRDIGDQRYERESKDAATTMREAIALLSRPSDGKLREALEAATDRCQKFLDTFGDLGDCVTQADINDWVDALATERKE